MRLRKLTIRTLPGIEPGFTFEPPGAGVNLVVGPNASGKSSLTRALKYLLGDRKGDPPALSLEAELDDGATRWQVTRNGSQIAWRRGGEPALEGPALPGVDQIGLYRLSVEHLLDADDAGDKELAGLMRKELLGNCDLDALRSAIQPASGSRFGRSDAKALDAAASARRQVQNRYEALQRDEETLPDLQRRIETAKEAGKQHERLNQALKLAAATDARLKQDEQLKRFPPEMAGLRGDEVDRLDEHEKKADKLREELLARRLEREAAVADLERTGLAHAAPAGEHVQAAAEKLRTLDTLKAERKNAGAGAVKAEADAQDARAQLGGSSEPPRIDASASQRAEEIARTLIGAQQRLAELRTQLELAGEAPDPREVDRLRDGARALRDWLASRGAETEPAAAAPAWLAWFAAAGAAAAGGLAAYAQAVAAALIAVLAALLATAAAAGLWRVRQRPTAASPPTADAERRYRDTGLDAPAQWEAAAVRQHLRDMEDEWDERRAQQKRAGDADRIQADMGKAQEELDRQEAARADLAAGIGFDPAMPATAFDRFVRLCGAWDRARVQHAEKQALLAQLDREITETARGVSEFLDAWPADSGAGNGNAKAGNEGHTETAVDLQDLDLLRKTFERLEARVVEADKAKATIRGREDAIKLINQQIAAIESDVRQLFAGAGVETGDRATLSARLEQWPDWKAAQKELDAATREEERAREALEDRPELIEQAGAGERAQLQAERDAAAAKAAKHEELIREQEAVCTRLDETGQDRKLEHASAAESRARQALEDRRDEALLAAATELLLDDVEQAFEAGSKPEILRRAGEIFEEVNAHAFELQLRADGTFAARDTRQGAVRTLGELSSGTRMQLLLALRLAWTEAQERGGATLPLFLDEALTTSDEERFAVMARSLERIANAEDDRQRQIFYLSARRDEAALWLHATGSEPPLIDLAEVRFDTAAATPETYRVGKRAAIPAPDADESAEDYASRLGVPRCDPRLPPDGIHLFYLLRDDLPGLHVLMDTWNIDALGPLEGLLASDAAAAAAGSADACSHFRLRCCTARKWTDLWRQGRGRPVDRGVLEQCSAISTVFIDRAAELAEQVQDDGQALVRELRGRALPHFHTVKADELEQWLADEGYTDDRERLSADERRRLTLQSVAPETEGDAQDVNQVIDWLESAATWLEPAPGD